MQCCRCNLRLDTGHHTGGGIYRFEDETFCKPCLQADALWKKSTIQAFDNMVSALRGEAPEVRTDQCPPTLAKIEATTLRKYQLQEVDVWNNVQN